MKIYLIRHGRQCSKLCNVNVDLSQEGFRQAALVGERLVKKNIDKVYSSDYLRAVQTAQAANLYWSSDVCSSDLRAACRNPSWDKSTFTLHSLLHCLPWRIR